MELLPCPPGNRRSERGWRHHTNRWSASGFPRGRREGVSVVSAALTARRLRRMSSRSMRWITTALLLALPVVVHAQTARVEGMAIQNDYIKDYSNIFTWLSQVPNVGNIVYGDF